jgi:hypothetical protein
VNRVLEISKRFGRWALLPADRTDALAVVALGLLWLAWVAWQLPLMEGRDYGRYLTAFYDLTMAHPPQPTTMMYRGFLTSMCMGLFHELGGRIVFEVAWAAGLLAVWGGAFYLGSRFCRLGGWLALFFLAWDAPFWSLFRSVASEPFWIVGLLFWYGILRRAFRHPGWKAALVFGLATALLPLIRPSGQPFVLGCFLLLGAPGSVRANLRRSFLAFVVAIGMLGLYAGYNQIRYRDFTVARGSQATLPFQRLMVTDGLIHPDNGPVSREVAGMVRKRLLGASPYLEYGIDEETFFSGGGTRQYWDLLYVADAEYGWASDYRKLKEMALEAVAAHPWAYLQAVGNSLALHFEVMDRPLGWTRIQTEQRKALLEKLREDWRAKGLEIPDENELAPRSASHWVKSRPEGYQMSKRPDWAKEGIRKAHEVFPSSRQESRQIKVWKAASTRLWVPIFFWILAGLLLVPASWGKERGEAWPLLGLLVLSLLVLGVSTLAIGHVEKYRIIFDPVLIGCGAAGVGWLAARKR